ncbi:DUF4382 domain-containing protein [filamentous cyanobacterium CCP2]|nr:DUF4382 domain-containing protein [filamentous cyanobacterium CCP2]
MNQSLAFLSSVLFLGTIVLQSCAGQSPQAEAPASDSATTEQAANDDAPEAANSDGTGTLQIRANGEEFVREGFVTKDGWEISFDHLYVNLVDVTAYQTDAGFDPEAGQPIQPKEQVSLDEAKTVDLTGENPAEETVLVGEVEAPSGRYNALSWRMIPAADGPAAGYPMVLQGTATKDGETIDFTLRFEEELAFVCGDFVGDERKGFLEAGDAADLEATFHFDHLFGDAEAPADDEINTGALGFDPFAAIAQNNQLDANSTQLQEQLSDAEYSTLLEILPSLGHVGEGHCQETTLT